MPEGCGHGIIGACTRCHEDRLAAQRRRLGDENDELRAELARVRETAATEIKRLEALLASGVAVPDTVREFLEHWSHEGHLQTFEDRERFRKAARELLADGVGEVHRG